MDSIIAKIHARARLTAFVALSLVVLLWHWTPPVWADAAPAKVAVLPFHVQTPAGLAYLGPALTEIFCSRLAVPGRVAVMESGEVRQAFEESGTAFLPEATRDLGRRFGADHVVVGRVAATGNTADIEVSMLPVTHGVPDAQLSISSVSLEEMLPRVEALVSQLVASMTAGKEAGELDLREEQQGALIAPKQENLEKQDPDSPGRMHPDRFYYSTTTRKAPPSPSLSQPSSLLIEPVFPEATKDLRSAVRPPTSELEHDIDLLPEYPTSPDEPPESATGTSPKAPPAPSSEAGKANDIDLLPESLPEREYELTSAPPRHSPSERKGWFSWLRWPWRGTGDKETLAAPASACPPEEGGSTQPSVESSAVAKEPSDAPMWEWY